MNASLEQTAVASYSRYLVPLSGGGKYLSENGEQRAAVVVVDGQRFVSSLPQNAGEAESINRAARALVSRMNGRAA